MAETPERDWKAAWVQARRRRDELAKQRQTLAKHLMRVANIASDEVLARVCKIRQERMRLLYKNSGEADRQSEFSIGSAIFEMIRDDVPWLCDVITGELGMEIDQILDGQSRRMPAGGES